MLFCNMMKNTVNCLLKTFSSQSHIGCIYIYVHIFADASFLFLTLSHISAEIVWAVIAAKLLSIVKHRPESILTDYSAQYMLDFAPRPREAQIKHRRTCCKPLSVLDGLKYGLKNNLPREQDWKYAGCRDICKPTGVSLFRMVGDLRPTKRLSAALSALRMIPVAAQLHVFEPDIDIVGNVSVALS